MTFRLVQLRLNQRRNRLPPYRAYIHGVSGGICHTLEKFSYVNLHRYNHICVHTKLKGNGDNEVGRIWPSCCSNYCNCSIRYVTCTLRRSVLEPIAKPRHTEANVLPKLLWNLRKIFTKQVRDFIAYSLSLYQSDAIWILGTFFNMTEAKSFF